MRIIQLNLNHCKVAQDLLAQTVCEQKVDVAVICEQYSNIQNTSWIADCTNRTAIWACGRKPFEECATGSATDFVWAKIDGVYIYSCYFSPNAAIAEFEDMLDRLVIAVRGHKPLVIAGDFNAWATDWGSRTTSARGMALLDAFTSLDVVLANTGDAHTFKRGGVGSVIDITFMSPSLITKCAWKVSDIYTHSDHMAVLYDILKENRHALPDSRILEQKLGWRSKGFDAESFILMWEDTDTLTGDIVEKVTQLSHHLNRACDASMPRKSVYARKRAAMYWWNDDIADLRNACNRARRLYQRARGMNTYIELQQQYKNSRKQLKSAIKRSKRNCFMELCNDADQNPWGTAYRVVMSKFKCFGLTTPSDPGTMLKIVETLFPGQFSISQHYARNLEPNSELVPQVTVSEVLEASIRFGNTKAPGPDGIPNIALKAAIKTNPAVFADLYSECLREGVFPTKWKKQRLVLLPKGNKPPGNPESYRPLCMIDTVSKIFERVICNRLEAAVESCEGLAEHQYGFRKTRSTIDAIQKVVSIAQEAVEGKRWRGGSKKYCLIVTLDVKNAFNSASWNHIMRSLERMRVPLYLCKIVGDYLDCRTLSYSTENGDKWHNITRGVPQGSVLGPLLWNIMYDGILRITFASPVKLIGYADDIAVVVVAKSLAEVHMVFNEAMEKIVMWLNTVGLNLAGQKTEAVLVSSRKRNETLTINVDGHNIASQPFIKYLGVTIDSRLNFKEHLRVACCKATRVNAALSRIMPNIGGPRHERRKLLAKVVSSIILYGVPIWAEALKTASYAAGVKSVYRQSALRVCSAFRTVSDEAVYVISGMHPIDLLAFEAQRLYRTSRNEAQTSDTNRHVLERVQTVLYWQQRWTATTKGRWTHRLIPSLDLWLNRTHGEVNFYLTQLLSGHGCFRAYLHRFGHDETSVCAYGCPTCEDAEHVFFHCPRFMEERVMLSRTVGQWPDANNIVTIMLESEEAWNAVSNFAANIMKEQRRLERERHNS